MLWNRNIVPRVGGRPKPIPAADGYAKKSDEHGEYRLVPLTQGVFAKVDEADVALVNQNRWCAKWDKESRSYYAVRGQWDKEHKRVRAVSMARFICGFPSRKVDHADHDTLNNRRHNLRIASDAESARNTRKVKRKTSRFKGVEWHKQRRLWRSRITVDRKSIYLGHFETEEAAADAYRAASVRYHGDFGCVA